MKSCSSPTGASSGASATSWSQRPRAPSSSTRGRDETAQWSSRRAPSRISGVRRIARSPSGSLTKPLSSTPPLPCATSSFAPAYKSPIETVAPSSEMLRGQTYTHHHLRNLLRLALTHLYGATVAALYPWHSFRSRLATALHAANVPDSMIMLICRWMSPESSPCPSADGDPRTRATDQLGLLHERRRHPTCQRGTCGWRSGVGSSLRRPAARPIGPCERLRSDIQHRARHAHPPAHTGGAYHAHGAAASSAAATRTASAANVRRPTSAPATTAGHYAAKRRRGRPSRPLAGLLLQRARRRRVGGHDTPCPRIDCRVSFGVAQTRDGRPYKTDSYHSTNSEWSPSSRPDFPPASPCGNREFWADVPHRNRDHRPTVRCVVYIHPFPTTSRTQEGGFSAQRDMSSCSGRLHHGGPGWGP